MSNPQYGRFQAPEPPSNLALLHFHDGVTALKTVDHEPKVGILDQSDLIRQGINTSVLIPGAKTVDALGSCTANTFIEAASNILDETAFAATVGRLASRYPESDPYTDVVVAEEAAIGFYALCTHQTGDPSTEWPPTDCGSSGPYIASEAIKQRVSSKQAIAHSPESIVSLLQSDGVLWGTPFFYAWEQPGPNGMIDGNGTVADMRAAIASGLAGGHEIYISAVEKVSFLASGQVNPAKTILRFRNHWTKTWGDHGSGRVHLSTLAMLGSHCDYRQLIK